MELNAAVMCPLVLPLGREEDYEKEMLNTI